MQAESVTAEGDAGLRLVNAPATFWRGTASDLRDVWASRELLRAFTARELRSRYKGSNLGWAWALVRPLVMLLIYGLAVGVFLGAGRATPQFMIFIYCGLLAWGLFSTIVMGAINSVVANGALLSRASFPRLLLPLSVLASALVDFALQASVLAVAYAIFQDVPSASSLLWLPPALLLLVLFALAVGLFFAAVNVYVRDVGFLVDIGLQVGFWLTPILYSYGQVVRGAQEFGVAGELATRVYMLNPMANVVFGFHEALWPAVDTEAAEAFAFPGQLDLRLAVFTVLAGGLLWLGMRVFVRLSGNFGQEL
ncbi:MAG: transporter permease [Frankiales bacterium]|nr:transporter permease [Frankiales bacterium]